MGIDQRVAPYLGRVLDAGGGPAGTCFQVASGVLVTAWHVLDALDARGEGAAVAVDPLQGGPTRQARVARADPLHDLAVLVTGEPLPGSVAGLAASDEVDIGVPVVITGVSVFDDAEHCTWHDLAEAPPGGLFILPTLTPLTCGDGRKIRAMNKPPGVRNGPTELGPGPRRGRRIRHARHRRRAAPRKHHRAERRHAGRRAPGLGCQVHGRFPGQHLPWTSESGAVVVVAEGARSVACYISVPGNLGAGTVAAVLSSLR